MIIDVRELERLSVENGLKFIGHTRHHYKVIGDLIVNVYPTTGTVHIIGMCKGVYHGSLEKIILAAKGEYAYVPTERTSRPSSKSMAQKRRKLWSLGRRNCVLCNRKFDSIFETTVDHKIPLSKGGTNMLDNLQLACEPCNQAKGSHLKIPPQKKPSRSPTQEEILDVLAGRPKRRSINTFQSVAVSEPSVVIKVEQKVSLLAKIKQFVSSLFV